MRPSRNRLIHAARRSMIQRAETRRKLEAARDALKPAALIGRGKYRAREKIDEATRAARRQFRDNRLPLAIAAAAGVAWLLREPIKDHAPRLGRKIQDLATAAMNRLRPSDTPDAAGSDMMESDDEVVQ